MPHSAPQQKQDDKCNGLKVDLQSDWKMIKADPLGYAAEVILIACAIGLSAWLVFG